MVDRDERHRARIEAERKRRRAAGPAARHARAVRRRNAVLAGSGALALALAGWALFLRDDGASGQDGPELEALGRTGSVLIEGAPAVEVASPESFRIVYRVEDAEKGVSHRTDVVSVRRPWESRLETRSGPPPGDEELSVQVATFGQRMNRAAGQDPSVFELGPVLPASDLRLDDVLEPAVAAGRLERREVREVLDRRCQVYRSGDYLSAAALSPPLPDLYADSCVDAAGLLLEEVLVVDGTAIARRIAVDVDEEPTLADDLFPSGEPTVPASAGGGTMHKLAEGSMPPGTFLVADAIPEGFTSIGRYSVVPPQAENFGDDPTRAGFRRAMVSDVYVRGVDVLILEQGATLEGAAPFEVDPTNPTLDVGPYGTAEVRFSALGNQVRSLQPGGRFVQATGTLTPDELATVLRSLREVPGGELVFEDDD